MRNDNQVSVNAAVGAASGFVRVNCYYGSLLSGLVTPHIQKISPATTETAVISNKKKKIHFYI